MTLYGEVSQPLLDLLKSDLDPEVLVDFLQASQPKVWQKLAQQYGGSPRATLYLSQAARAHAFIRGRGYVTPEDVKSVGPDVLRHRVILSYEAEIAAFEARRGDARADRIADGGAG